MTQPSPDLAALIGSRLCHDLVSPLGAIGNGLELLRMTQATSPELDLVEDSVKVAQARIRLFRLAFGAAAPDQSVSLMEVRQALDALSANGRICVKSDLPASIARNTAQRLTLAALCAETAMAWGGDVMVTPDGVTANARRLKLDDDLWQPLTQGQAPDAQTSATVHFALLAQSGPVTLALSETNIAIRV